MAGFPTFNFDRKRARKALQAFMGLFTKVVCIFDDIPFLFLETAGSIGTFLLAGAGFLIFPVEMLEGILELRGALKKKKENCPQRTGLISLAISQIIFSIVGLAASSALIAFTVM